MPDDNENKLVHSTKDQGKVVNSNSTFQHEYLYANMQYQVFLCMGFLYTWTQVVYATNSF